jgi:hypothetical protein
MARKQTITIGTRVRLTARFLRNTGQQRGREGVSRWVVQAITPNGWAQTDEPLEASYVASAFTPAELAANPGLAFRHIALANLEPA